VLMGLEEKVREFNGMTDGAVANQIFGDYQFSPAPANTRNDSPAHSEDEHTLMQRGSDLDFLRRLARRTGRWCRVACGSSPGQRTGYFAPPDVEGDPVAKLKLNDPAAHAIGALDFHWDVMRPTEVTASQASLSDADAMTTTATSSGLRALDQRDLSTFAGRSTSVLLTAAADGAELEGRAAGVLAESGWLARCEGTADVASLGAVLRVGAIVAVEGAGSMLSGNYLARRVRHTITGERHTMAFTLIRNAVGPAGAR
jgi:phage protein D